MKNDIVDWDDPALKRWLNTIRNKRTRYTYRTAFRAYTLFTGMKASALVDEALDDARLDPRERKDVVMQRLINFYNWCKTDYPRKTRGRGSHRIIGKGVSDKLANMLVSAVRSFYSTFGVTVRLKGRHALPRPRVRNRRMKVAAEQVKVLVDHARTPRDRAIILTLFQGGMDVSTLCSLRYGDFLEALRTGKPPLKLELFRQKSGVEYYTFLGRDAAEALKAYVADMENLGVEFRHDTPLFLKGRGREGLRTNNVQAMMRKVALKAGFVDGDNNGKAFNPLGPHALRESFGSIMINSGVPDTIVDFWLGHSIGEMAEAYKSIRYESLRKMYRERERLLSISTGKLDEQALEEKVTEKVDEKIEALQKVIANYAAENEALRQRITEIQAEVRNIAAKFREMESAT